MARSNASPIPNSPGRGSYVAHFPYLAPTRTPDSKLPTPHSPCSPTPSAASPSSP